MARIVLCTTRRLVYSNEQTEYVRKIVQPGAASRPLGDASGPREKALPQITRLAAIYTSRLESRVLQSFSVLRSLSRFLPLVAASVFPFPRFAYAREGAWNSKCLEAKEA